MRLNGGSRGNLQGHLERPSGVDEEVELVKRVQDQIGCTQVSASKLELHITESVHQPKPK